MHYQPDAGTSVRVNGVDKGRVAGADLHEALMRIWLGERPRDPRLRMALLGRATYDTASAQAILPVP